MPSELLPAKFGVPVKSLRHGGTHIAVEVIPKRGEYLYAAGDKGSNDLYFPIDLITFGEDFDSAVRRILKSQLCCALDDFYLATVKSHVDGNAHWSITLVFVARLGDEPSALKKKSLERFTESTLPAGLQGWSHSHLRDALEK